MLIEKNKIKTSDGKKLCGRFFHCDKPRTVILIQHGLGEHSGRYEHVAEFFVEHEFAVMIPDIRGHGHSGGRRGHAESYNILLTDIDLWLNQIEKKYPEIPVFLYGHSMGGNLVLNYVIRRNSEIAGVIATSPWLKLVKPPSIFIRVLASILSAIAPFVTFDNGLQSEDLSRLEDSRRKRDDDKLVHNRISAGLFTIIQKAGRHVLEKAEELTCPVLLLQGGNDRIISREATEKITKRAINAEYIFFPECHHEIQNEPECESALDRIINWIEKNYAANSKSAEPTAREKKVGNPF